MHETKSELVEKMEEMPHETESEFGGLREASSPSLPARSPSDSRGEGGGATFLAAAKKAVPEKKKVSDLCRILLYEN